MSKRYQRVRHLPIDIIFVYIVQDAGRLISVDDRFWTRHRSSMDITM